MQGAIFYLFPRTMGQSIRITKNQSIRINQHIYIDPLYKDPMIMMMVLTGRLSLYIT